MLTKLRAARLVLKLCIALISQVPRYLLKVLDISCIIKGASFVTYTFKVAFFTANDVAGGANWSSQRAAINQFSR
jgi:hypothetical protein